MECHSCFRCSYNALKRLTTLWTLLFEVLVLRRRLTMMQVQGWGGGRGGGGVVVEAAWLQSLPNIV
jgi:hypothetical protein